MSFRCNLFIVDLTDDHEYLPDRGLMPYKLSERRSAINLPIQCISPFHSIHLTFTKESVTSAKMIQLAV
jgi:hypothetical protein